MGPFRIVVGDELRKCPSAVRLANRHQPVETLLLDRPDRWAPSVAVVWQSEQESFMRETASVRRQAPARLPKRHLAGTIVAILSSPSAH